MIPIIPPENVKERKITEEIHCTTIGPQYGNIVSKNEDYLDQWYSNPDLQDDIRRNIDDITRFLKSNYGLLDKNIEISVYTGMHGNVHKANVHKVNYINGVRYELDNIKIIGEIFIVFMADSRYDYRKETISPYYIFRTEIEKIPVDKIPCDSIDIYMKFRTGIIELSDALEFKLDKYEHFLGRNIYTEPIFYQRQEMIDVNSFRRFIEGIAHIGEIFPLIIPKRRWYATCSKAEYLSK